MLKTIQSKKDFVMGVNDGEQLSSLNSQLTNTQLTNSGQRPAGKRFGKTTLSALIVAVLFAPSASVFAQAGPDSDGDGVANTQDLDDDNDGILDVNEGLIDSDGNGVPDSNSTDTDGDGVPDGLDLDSDNDGILDNLETQTDRNAVIALDLNPNGAIDISFAVGANGIADAIETSPDSGILIYNSLDSDGDGAEDFRDTDSDNDGIFDIVEAGGNDRDANGRIDDFFDGDDKGVDDRIQASALPIFDTDGDGTLDFRDIDSDNDTISDAVESFGSSPARPTDTDGDGAADFRETDSDGDGVLDIVEAGPLPGEPADTNGDGRFDFQDGGIANASQQSNTQNATNSGEGNGANANPNGPDIDADGIVDYIDLDDDNDGIPDFAEGLIDANGDGVADANSRDSDGDGTPDGYDLDSDNDGLLDNREAHPDFGFVSSLDQFVNGAIDISVEVGSNGIADIIETSPDSGVINFGLQDVDGDGTPDFIDIDSDNDGIVDLIEAGGVDSNGDGRIDNFVDADNKGVDDAVQASALPVFDTDGDGTADYRDTDSDNDGLSDSNEAGSNPGQPTDTDGDGAADFRETDSDGDGVRDGQQSSGNTGGDNTGGDNNNGGGSAVDNDPRPDVDGDGIANQDDIDDDNDGIPDSVEGLIDADGDGIADANSRDSDGDGTPDGNDLDSDNDGLLDIREAHPDFNFISSLDQLVNGAIDIGVDVGSNGLANVLETSADNGELTFSIQDTDNDGTPDFIDLDSDGDGIPDLTEAGGVDADGDGRIDNFFDGDDKGVDDAIQSSALPVFDTDGDGVADYRDTDSDADTIPDMVEAGPNPTNPIDTDGDGAQDFREQDSNADGVADNDLPPVPPVTGDVDGDGIANDIDLDADNDGLLNTIEGEGDSDGDSTLDMYDLDSDNDGITDIAEAAELIDTVLSLDLDNDGRLDSPVGSNGFADILESTPDSGVSTFIVADSDGDGVPDFKDLDSDNDSIFDAFESGREVINMDGSLVAASNDDGLSFGANNELRDTDGDGVPDIRDLDSDNDGLVDLLEANGTDSNGDGRIDQFDDINGDGADDGLQRTVLVLIDTDMDRTPDHLDLDSDNDGLTDLLESLGAAFDSNNDGLLDSFIDANNDGLDDNLAGSSTGVLDTDQDGIPDQVDLDSDGDDIFDLVEAGGVDINNDGITDILADSDGDGIPDIADVSNTGGDDTDQDGIDDMFDVTFITSGSDSDGDGIADQFDPDNDGNGFVGPGSANNDGQGIPFVLPDADGNGVPDTQQGILEQFIARPGQVETGLDGTAFGCSVIPSTNGSSKKGFDPMFLLLLAASFASVFWRKIRRVARPSGTDKGLRKAGLVVAAVSSLALSGCSSIGLGGIGNFGGVDRGSSAHKGRFYIGAGGLASLLEPNADKDSSVSVDDENSFGGTGQIGYDLTNRFSIEAHASDLGEATFNPRGEVGYQVGGLSALAYLFNDAEDRGRRQGINVFGRLGGGTMRNQGDGVRFERLNDYHLLAGIGAEYGFRSGIGVRAEFVAHETDAKYAQLGLVYRIGRAATRRRQPAPRIEVPEPAPLAVPQAPLAPDPIERAPLDSDNDGVLDTADNCPSTAIGVPVNPDGCAIFNGAIEGINFASGSDQLTSGAQGILSGVASTLNSFPEIRVAVEAHTDNQGSADGNLDLSKRRAIAVARYLVEQGVAGSRLKPQAYGESQPRETNATADGRRSNRRVEFQVIQ